FFFQAEDGIRDFHVTGVQTCALPIFGLAECLGDPDSAVRDGIAFEGLQHYMRQNLLTRETLTALSANLQAKLTAPDPLGFQRPRSEERRVGKECRSRWAPEQ